MPDHSPDLAVFPEDWDRALAVVAHPDDMEYGAAAAVARWTAQGKVVDYLLVTEGEAGMATMEPAVVGPLRRQEQTASCAEVGVDNIEFLGYPDGLVVADLALRRDLAARIRRHRPDVVLSINHRETWGVPGWNHADHRAVGEALLDAVRDAANPWVFTDLEGDAWGGVRFAAFGGSPAATHGVDVADTFERGVASLACHHTYLEYLGAGSEMADPDAFLRGHAEAGGERLGVDLAAVFEVIPF